MDSLKQGLEQWPFWSLVHFFAVFLGVTYLFGFAFAFHDQSKLDRTKNPPVYTEMPPLYSATLPFRDQKERDEPNKEPNANNANKVSCFYFKELKAKLETESAPPATQASSSITTDMRRRWLNDGYLKEIVTVIKGLSSAKLVRITLIGRADEKKIGQAAPYLSNYELSQARTQAVKYEMLSALISQDYKAWRNIEWVPLPLSNEQSSQQNNRCRDLSAYSKNLADDNKVVEASVETISNDAMSLRLRRLQETEVKPLDLLGYTYFSIYTITTTGYGDIMPTSDYARFLTSLANIFEVFFIVGFLNTLISLK